MKIRRIFIFVFGVRDWRDMTSECRTYPALPGQNPTRYPVPRVLSQRYTRTPGIVPQQSNRAHRSSGYTWYVILTELTEIPGTVWKSYRNSRTFQVGTRMLYPYPGYRGTGVQNSQKFRVRVWTSYRTHRSSGHGYGRPTEIAQVPVRDIPRVWFCTYYRTSLVFFGYW